MRDVNCIFIERVKVKLLATMAIPYNEAFAFYSCNNIEIKQDSDNSLP